jgi:chorismate mutase
MTQNTNELELLRNKLDDIDEQMVILLKERFEITRKIGIYKKQNDIYAVDPAREQFQFDRINNLATNNNVNPSLMQKILRLIIDAVVEEHKQLAKN